MFVAIARGQTTAPTSQPSDFAQQLEAIDRRAGEIKDLTADFVQEKRSPLLRKPLISRGNVKARGGLALWETTEPEPTKMSVDPQLLRMYYPKQKTIEEYPMQQQLGMMAASPLPRLQAIQTTFSMKPDDGKGLLDAKGASPANPRAVRMEPVDAEIRKYVDHVRVLLDADRGLVLAFEMVDPDGEQTIIRFSNVRTGVNLTDESLKLDTPAGVKVVRPLEGAR
ncbi:MAG: outer membrane lipoprotein carrier protein LolA [Anaerolineae bacterium]|nr:outer membrane lipoprotein carrier protein LolA [Phycisphaerae bacterium]